MKTEIEKIFEQDSREKKRIGTGVTKRASRKGFIRGGVKFPSDFLTNKEKKKLNGEIKMSNIYDEKFGDLSKITRELITGIEDIEERGRVLSYLKKRFSHEKLAEQLNYKSGSLFKFLRQNGYKKADSTVSGSIRLKDYEVKILTKYIQDNNLIVTKRRYDEMLESHRIKYLSELLEQWPRIVIARNWGLERTHIGHEAQKYNLNKISMTEERAKEMFRLLEGLKSKVEYKNIISTSLDGRLRQISAKTNVESPIQKINEDKVKELVKNNMQDKLENSENLELKKEINSLKEKIELLTEKLDSKEKNKKSRFNFSIDGKFSKDEMEKRLVSISYILDEENLYNLKLSIEEVEKKEEVTKDVKKDVEFEDVKKDVEFEDVKGYIENMKI